MRLETLAMTTFGALSAVAIGAALLLGGPPARACWDGIWAETGRVTIAEARGLEPWTAQTARTTGTWLRRIEALLPRGTTLRVEQGALELCGSEGAEFGCVEPDPTWNDGELATLFDMVADLVHATPEERSRARRLRTKVLTIQVAATSNERAATALARRLHERLADQDVMGFLEIGGFPADNSAVHILSGPGHTGRLLHRVVVGSFLEPAEARAALAILKDAGMQGFVLSL